MNKYKLSNIGLVQALGIVAYCSLVALFFQFANQGQPDPKGIWAPVLMLTLLVFSVAVSGGIVFGYSAYLAMQNQLKDSIVLFIYTILYCLIFILIGITMMSVLS